MLQIHTIKAISLDLDDTLWPIWPVIDRAEKALLGWLHVHAPQTAQLFASPAALREIRDYVVNELVESKPEIRHDLSAIRRESIRLALARAGDDTALAEPAFDVFFAERCRVELYSDVLPALQAMAALYPLVALSNGNANVHTVGIGAFFKAAISSSQIGFSKPDIRIFHAAASAAGVQPHEVLHVGDDASLDVLGGMGAGMQTVWLNRDEKLWPHDHKRPTLEVGSLQELTDLLAAQ